MANCRFAYNERQIINHGDNSKPNNAFLFYILMCLTSDLQRPLRGTGLLLLRVTVGCGMLVSLDVCVCVFKREIMFILRLRRVVNPLCVVFRILPTHDRQKDHGDLDASCTARIIVYLSIYIIDIEKGTSPLIHSFLSLLARKALRQSSNTEKSKTDCSPAYWTGFMPNLAYTRTNLRRYILRHDQN